MFYLPEIVYIDGSWSRDHVALVSHLLVLLPMPNSNRLTSDGGADFYELRCR